MSTEPSLLTGSLIGPQCCVGDPAQQVAASWPGPGAGESAAVVACPCHQSVPDHGHLHLVQPELCKLGEGLGNVLGSSSMCSQGHRSIFNTLQAALMRCDHDLQDSSPVLIVSKFSLTQRIGLVACTSQAASSTHNSRVTVSTKSPERFTNPGPPKTSYGLVHTLMMMTCHANAGLFRDF